MEGGEVGALLVVALRTFLFPCPWAWVGEDHPLAYPSRAAGQFPWAVDCPASALAPSSGSHTQTAAAGVAQTAAAGVTQTVAAGVAQRGARRVALKVAPRESTRVVLWVAL